MLPEPSEGSTAAGERVGRDLFLQAQTRGAHPHRAPRQPVTGEDSRGYGKALRATGQSWEHKPTLNLGAEHEPPSRATSPHPCCCRKNTFPTWGAAATRLPLCCFTSSWYNFISCRNRLIINARQLRSLSDPPPTPPPPQPPLKALLIQGVPLGERKHPQHLMSEQAPGLPMERGCHPSGRHSAQPWYLLFIDIGLLYYFLIKSHIPTSPTHRPQPREDLSCVIYLFHHPALGNSITLMAKRPSSSS